MRSAWLQVSCSETINSPQKLISLVKIPRPKEPDTDTDDVQTKTDTPESGLPQTLVRIPTEHAPMLQAATNGGDGES